MQYSSKPHVARSLASVIGHRSSVICTVRRLITVFVLAAVAVLGARAAYAGGATQDDPTGAAKWHAPTGDDKPRSTAGDETRRGTAGAAHLRIPTTARLAALGTAGTAGLTDLNGVEALFVNPAALMLNRGTSVLFSRMEYVVGVGINTLGVAQQIGTNNLALFITSWDFGDIPRQTESNPEISDLTFQPRIITAGVAYARQFTDRIAVGVTVKVINEDIDDLDATAVAFDGGITYAIDRIGLRLGFSVKNIGTKLNYGGAGLTRRVQLGDQRPDADAGTLTFESESVDLPTLLNFGATFTRRVTANATVSVLGNFRSNSFDQDQFAGGLEVGLLDLFYVRGGFEFTQDQDLTLFKSGTLGAGLKADVAGLAIAFDYAYRPTTFFSDVQVFTLNVTI